MRLLSPHHSNGRFVIHGGKSFHNLSGYRYRFSAALLPVIFIFCTLFSQTVANAASDLIPDTGIANNDIRVLPTSSALSEFQLVTGTAYNGSMVLTPDEEGLTVACGEGKSGFFYQAPLSAGYAVFCFKLIRVPGYIDGSYTVNGEEKPQAKNLMFSINFSSRNSPATLDRQEFWEGILINVYPLNPSGSNVEVYYNRYGDISILWEGLLEMNLSDGASLDCGIVVSDVSSSLEIGNYSLDILPEEYSNSLRNNDSIYLTMVTNTKSYQPSDDAHSLYYRLLSIGDRPVSFGENEPDFALQKPQPELTAPPLMELLSAQQSFQLSQLGTGTSSSSAGFNSAGVPENSSLWQKDTYKVRDTKKQDTFLLFSMVILISALTAIFIIKILQKPSER